MSILEESRAVTVYCPECRAPMHLPNRDLLGCKARCWKCQEKVVLTESPPELPPSMAADVEPELEPARNDGDDVPEELWDEEEDTASLSTHDELEIRLENEESVAITAAELRELPKITKVKIPTDPNAAPPPVEKPIIVACGYCRTRIPVVGDLLETDGCPCCGSRVAGTQYQLLQVQPAWAEKAETVWMEEEVRGPFGRIYHGRSVATGDPLTVREIPNDCWLPKDSQQILAGLWKVREFTHRFVGGFDAINVHNGRVYLVGPHLPGQSLSDYLARQVMSPLEIAKLGWVLADVLEAAHSTGLLHRDLKPANVLLTQNDGPMVLGFGAPRRKTGGGFLKGPQGLVVGTVGYLAPEQALGAGPADPRSDVYSLGIMLFQMLTGRLPFQGTLTQVLDQIAKKALPIPSKIRSDLSWEWDVVCRRCTAKKPKDRYQSAGELRDALQNIGQSLRRS